MTTVKDELARANDQIAELKAKLRSADSEVESLILHSCEEPRDHRNLHVLLEAVRTEHDFAHHEPWSICAFQVCRLASQIKG